MVYDTSFLTVRSATPVTNVLGLSEARLLFADPKYVVAPARGSRASLRSLKQNFAGKAKVCELSADEELMVPVEFQLLMYVNVCSMV